MHDHKAKGHDCTVTIAVRLNVTCTGYQRVVSCVDLMPSVRLYMYAGSRVWGAAIPAEHYAHGAGGALEIVVSASKLSKLSKLISRNNTSTY